MITLHVDGYFTNQFDATCVIALEEKRAAYHVSRALLRDGRDMPAALTARTGIARVPALQDREFWLTESLAIAEYIDEVCPGPRLFPADPRARARARQLMVFLRCELLALREERSWWMCVYPPPPLPPLSAAAEADARLLTGLIDHFAGELGAWNLAHADLALTLYRLARTAYPLPAAAQRLLDANLVRPSVRAYLDRPRPPNPPPRDLAAG